MKDETLDAVNPNRQSRMHSSSSKERIFAALNKNASNSARIRNETDCNAVIRQVNEYSYVISLDSSPHVDHHLDQSAIERIHRDLAGNQDALLANDGLIHMKEFALDSYQCRCANEPNRPFHQHDLDSDEHSVNYQLKF